ncbi:MAG TPA: ISAs1 family transposase [Candidatus Saccharimonadia bacterium]|nr:ISAs1 family transposase [Candidatus Saccharimonadia bacterium]
MIAQPRPLIEVLAEMPDLRSRRGKRHPLSAILAMACCAMLCGYRSYSALAEWGRNYGTGIAQALGFTHNTPCAATLHTIFRQVDRDDLEARLGTWAESVVASTPAASAGEVAVALDGKTLRGSQKQGAPGVHLLSALSHHVGLTLTQQAVDAKTNEMTQVETVLRQLVLKDRVVTMDALLTQRHVAQAIVDEGGDYVMIVKENQPQLRADIELVFTLPPAGDRQETARTVDIGHGRIEQRNITTSEALVGYSDWPGLAQVFELGRHVIMQKTGQERVEVVYGVTSLSAERATPGRVLDLVRGHWSIENKSHWVRDVTFDEDRSQVRCGSIPQVMAALRNTAIGLLRWAGHTNIAAACRRLAAQPAQALALIGIEFEN